MSRRRQSFHEDVHAYREVVREAFTGHYAAGTDVWSQDDSLMETARAAVALWRDWNGGRRPHVLDIGCGNGRAFRVLHSEIAGYLGVDLCTNPEWQELQTGELPRAEFVVGNFLEWSPQQDGDQYDLVLDHGCLHHQHPADQPAYLQGIFKLLKPGGAFSLVVWAESWKEEDIGEDGRFHLPFTKQQLEELLVKAGFQLQQVVEIRARVGTQQYHAVACKPVEEVNKDV